MLAKVREETAKRRKLEGVDIIDQVGVLVSIIELAHLIYTKSGGIVNHIR